ncbi:hypothetical protein Cgig2_026947 [Carnegiea gigantea]|uniref:Uncharacterized protein n=1 Tax=Carnegiea gigantea TaxID=171969 RepID=A0A9Q1QQ56_9CARY|nr:hypothetical protein Cgig2_026947 [Carnegiea gigantea]
MEVDSPLVWRCIEAASESRDAVERWRMQRRTLHRLPSPIASALLHRLLHRRLLYPSLLEVFKFSVEEVDLRGENSVDAEWMAYLGAFPYLRSLNVAECHRVNNSTLWPLAGMTSLKELDLSRCTKVTDAGIKHLLSVSHLEKLYLSQTGVTAAGIKLLSELVNLSTLDLGGSPVTDLALNSLQVLTNLEHLDLWGSKISDVSAVTFKKFPKLSFLSLAWTNVTKLPNLKSLKCLDMSHCSIHSVTEDRGDKAALKQLIVNGASFPDGGNIFSNIDTSCLSFLNLSNSSLSYFGFLHQMHALEHLDLSFSTIQDDAVEAIARVGANLKHLNLNNTKISSAGVEILVGCVPNLEILLLSHTSIDDVALAYVSMMPSLKAIDLSNTNIKGFTHHIGNDEDEILSLISLQDLKHLESLDLEGTQVTDTSLHALSGIEALSHLSLGCTPLTDTCLDHLSSLKRLASLSIQGALLTNGSLDSFNPPMTLEVLDLRGCWLLTMEALTTFCETHPGIKVKHDHLSIRSMDHDDSHCHANSSQKGSNTLKSKEKYRGSGTPPLFRKEVLDQRIKYGREELLALQHPSSPFIPPSNIDTEVLKVD